MNTYKIDFTKTDYSDFEIFELMLRHKNFVIEPKVNVLSKPLAPLTIAANNIRIPIIKIKYSVCKGPNILELYSDDGIKITCIWTTELEFRTEIVDCYLKNSEITEVKFYKRYNDKWEYSIAWTD